MPRIRSGSRADAAEAWREAGQPRTPRMLPIVQIRGKPYFRDDRLGEFRAVDDPGDRISFEVMNWALVILGRWPD